MDLQSNGTPVPTESRPQFGNRTLEKEEDIFKHNAWDNVVWGEKQEKDASDAVAKNGKVTLSTEQIQTLEHEAADKWDKFYGIHQNKFFKNRNWLFTEFPELSSNISSESESNSKDSSPEESVEESFPGSNASFRILEIGCGVGNTIFPILEVNNDSKCFIYGADFSPTAIDIVKNSPLYHTKRCNAFVLDLTSQEWDVPFPEASLDAITCLFVFSAINPDKFDIVISNLYKYLKPGGLILFRDYGRYDLAQLRFKPGKCLSENFYVRGDGTRSYFITSEEVKKLFEDGGFVEEQNLVDRRLQTNRGKKITMYRVWVQAKYRKPVKV